MNATNLKSKSNAEIREYFQGKSLKDLDVSELAFIHLNINLGNQRLSDTTIYSSLYDLMQTSQASFNNVRTKAYTPLLSCFAMLDQLGGAYRSTIKPTKYTTGIKIALDTFGTYTKDEIEKLYSLRNGLYHDGSLTNIDKRNKHHVIFRLAPESSTTFIHPKQEWNGVYCDSLTEFITKINPKKFKFDLEKIISNCNEELKNGTLEISIKDPLEFFYKFLFSSQNSTNTNTNQPVL
ncbi:hypothetical protein [Ideonella livida]|uniref:Uncharacterized protein n=1 Tax=Ideonella livida TaxID=2707176 RepID=A0A7C9TML9_9BURK|nr:hypothetical protein [Ideonella livida]NDY91786.1 hypothetical protein [Ideonella livida]